MSPVQLAILMPTILLAIFAAIQLSVYYLARSAALTAAQAAVTAERQHEAQPGDGQDAAEQFLQEIAPAAGSWLGGAEVSDPVYGDGQVTYIVSGTAISLVPGMDWNIQQSATGTIEEFTD